MQMARKGQGIGIVGGVAGRLRREGFSSRAGAADCASGVGSGDDEFSGCRELRTQRRAARLAQWVQASDAGDASGRVGVDGSE